MVEFYRGIEWLHAAMAIPVQGQYLTAKNNATFYKLLADSNLLTPLEIRTLGRGTDLAGRVLASVRTFSSVLVEGIPADTATKPNLELAIEYSQALASVIKSDSFPQHTKVNALRSLAIDIDAGALARIADGDRKILRQLDAIRFSWVQQALNCDGQTPELYTQAYTVLATVRANHFVRSMAIPLVLAALIIKREVLPEGCGNSDDATVIASELYGEYESTRKDKKEPAEKRRRKPPTPTKDACPYKTAAALHGLAEAIESRLAALMTEDDLSDSGSESDDDEVVSSAHVALSASAAAAASACVSSAAAAAPSHDAAEDRSVVEARRLKRQRPVPLDIEEEDVVTAAAAAPGSFPSPESARSRAGTGVGSHHVAPLDEQRKQIIRELYDQFKRTNPTNYVIALTAYLNEEANVTKHRLPLRAERVTKFQIYRLMHPKDQVTP